MRKCIIGIAVGVLLTSAAVVLAGSLDSPGLPAATNSYNLEDIYARLDTGAAGTQTAFTEPAAGPGSTGHTLDQVMGMAPAVDATNGATQTHVLAGKTFWGLTSGEWGLQTGTAANADRPCFDDTNRYVDCGNGTVHDTVTNLIWLKNANCFGTLYYAAANNAAAGLEDGECGLTDGSSPGDWRLPTSEEWEATVERADALSCTNPHLTNTPGTGCYSVGPQPFTDVQSDCWSSSSYAVTPIEALYVWLGGTGNLYEEDKDENNFCVWPVRGGQ